MYGCAMTSAGTYRRISEDREGQEAGVSRQAEDVTELSARHRLDVVAEYTDNDVGASSRSRKRRPGYEAMLRDARAGKFDVIVAYSSSRLTRRPRENEDLIDLAVKHGIRYLFVRSPSFDLNSADGQQVARILAANDAAESERIAERVTRAAKARAEAGANHGGLRRYGFQCPCAEGPGERRRLGPDGQVKITQHVHPDPTTVAAEAEILRELTRRVIAGESTRGLAADLRRRGIPTGRGGVWSARVVKEIVCRPRNAGLRVANEGTPEERTYPATWDRIVDPEEWAAARAVLLDPARGVWRGSTPVSLLAGLATCWCGVPVASGAHSTYVGGRVEGRSCTHIKRSRPRADAVVDAYVLGVLDREHLQVPTTRSRPVQDHSAKITAVRRQIEGLEDKLADDLLTPAAYQRQVARKRAQLLRLEAEQVRTARPDVLAGVRAATWSALPLERRRAVIHHLCTIRLLVKGQGGDPETGVEITPKWRDE
jgi:site-specific DNA recombinase